MTTRHCISAKHCTCHIFCALLLCQHLCLVLVSQTLNIFGKHIVPMSCSLTCRLFLLQSGPVHTLTPITPALHNLQTTVSTFTSERIPQEPSYQAPNDRLFYLTHNCTPDCLKRIRPTHPNLHRGRNPLLTPLLYEFRRMTGRRRLNRKVCVA